MKLIFMLHCPTIEWEKWIILGSLDWNLDTNSVEEYKDLSSFSDLYDFIKYCKPHNIFTDDELENIFIKKSYTKIIKMAYNISFKRRVILKKIREIIGHEEAYWGFVKLTDEAFFAILKEGLVNDSIIIH